MWGWSISASACRSASNLATTWRVSMPGLITFRATLRRTGWACSATKTRPMPPSPISSRSVYGPITVPGASQIVCSAVAPGPRAGAPRKLPACSCRRSSLSIRSRRAGSPAQARSRKAARSAASSFVRASVNRDCSRMAASAPGDGFASTSPCDVRRRTAHGISKKEEGERQALRLFVLELFQQPGAGVGPHLVGLARRDAEDGRGGGVAEPREVAQLDQFGGLGVDPGQLGEGLVQGQQLFRLFEGGDILSVAHPDATAAVLQTVFPAGRLHQDAAHGLGGGGEEMAAAVPVLRPLDVHQSQISLVHQRRGLERLAGPFVGHLLGRQPVQLVVDQRQELLRGVRVALLDVIQDLGDVGHSPQVYRPWTRQANGNGGGAGTAVRGARRRPLSSTPWGLIRTGSDARARDP